MYCLIAITGLCFVRIIYGKNSKHCADQLIVIYNPHLADFSSRLAFWRRLKAESALPLVLISDQSIREASEASCLFDKFIGIDLKKAAGIRYFLYRWKTVWKLRKLSGKKAVQCFGAGSAEFEDFILMAVNAPDKYVFVDYFYNVQQYGVFYEALRTKFFNHTLPYRIELNLPDNESNYADFISGN